MDRTADDIFDEGDSLFSLPGPSNPRPLFRTPSTANSHNASNNAHTNSLRFRHHDPRFSSPVSVDYDPDGSGYSYQNASVIQGDEDLSGIADNGDGPSFEHGYEATLDREAEMAGIPVEEADGEVEESYDDASDGSSDLYDPDADPEAFAKRLDALAGVLEMNEVEATALKWDPPIGKDHRHRKSPCFGAISFTDKSSKRPTSAFFRFQIPHQTLSHHYVMAIFSIETFLLYAWRGFLC